MRLGNLKKYSQENKNKSLDENELTKELIQNLNEEKCLICLEKY